MPVRTTTRTLGSGRRYSLAPEVTFGRGTDGEPVVVILGGVSRRAPGLAFVDLDDLKALRRDLDDAIDLFALADREARS